MARGRGRRNRSRRRRRNNRRRVQQRQRRRRAARRRRRTHAINFTFAGTRPALQGYWRPPRFVGSAYVGHVPRTTVMPYQAPATMIIDNRNAAPRPMLAAQQPAVPQTKQLVQQQYIRVKFYNQDMLGFELEGAVVNNIVPGSPADDGGVEDGFYAFALNDIQQKPGTLMNALNSASRPYAIDFGFVPAGWEARWSEEVKRFYFAEHATQTTSWNLPPIPMSKKAVADVESQQTGRGDEGVFTVKVNIEFFPQDTQQAAIISEAKELGTLNIRLSKTTTVEALIQLVEDVQDGAIANEDYEIDYTSAYGKIGKLDDNALVSRVVSIDGEQVEICGHKQPREPDAGAAVQCCTIL